MTLQLPSVPTLDRPRPYADIEQHRAAPPPLTPRRAHDEHRACSPRPLVSLVTSVYFGNLTLIVNQEVAMKGPTSVYGALAVAHAHGVHLTESSFRSAVSRGKAPRPALSEGRQPYWQRSDITSWATGFTDGRRGERPPAPGALALRAPENLKGDVSGELEQAYQAATQLPEEISNLEQTIAALEQRYQSITAPPEPTSKASKTGPLNLRELFKNARSARSDEQTLAWLTPYLDETRDELTSARHDLGRAIEWLPKAQAWIEWAQYRLTTRGEHGSFTRWLENQSAAHADTGRTVTVTDWIAEDDARVARTETTHSGEPRTILNGADFGYSWTVPGIDRDCRMSWIQATGELYLVNADPARQHIVRVIATIPRGTSIDEMISWLEPFESIMDTPGAYGLLMLEIALQQTTDWAGARSQNGLPSATDEEGS